MVIEIRICMGTTCYVAGNSEIKDLEDIIKEKYGNSVKIIKSGCMGLCSTEWKEAKAPYVKINDEVVSNATKEKIMQSIEKYI